MYIMTPALKTSRRFFFEISPGTLFRIKLYYIHRNVIYLHICINQWYDWGSKLWKVTFNYYSKRKIFKGIFIFPLGLWKTRITRKIDAVYDLGREYWNPLYKKGVDKVVTTFIVKDTLTFMCRLRVLTVWNIFGHSSHLNASSGVMSICILLCESTTEKQWNPGSLWSLS